MCSAPKPPDPVAPPAPISRHTTEIDARAARQANQRRRSIGANSETTMATPAGGVPGAAPVASPVLGV